MQYVIVYISTTIIMENCFWKFWLSLTLAVWQIEIGSPSPNSLILQVATILDQL